MEESQVEAEAEMRARVLALIKSTHAKYAKRLQDGLAEPTAADMVKTAQLELLLRGKATERSEVSALDQRQMAEAVDAIFAAIEQGIEESAPGDTCPRCRAPIRLRERIGANLLAAGRAVEQAAVPIQPGRGPSPKGTVDIPAERVSERPGEPPRPPGGFPLPPRHSDGHWIPKPGGPDRQVALQRMTNGEPAAGAAGEGDAAAAAPAAGEAPLERGTAPPQDAPAAPTATSDLEADPPPPPATAPIPEPPPAPAAGAEPQAAAEQPATRQQDPGPEPDPGPGPAPDQQPPPRGDAE